MANLHRFKGYYNTGHFSASSPPAPTFLFSFFISHSLAVRLTPVSADADILRAFHNPFDVRLSAVMSLFKGFSVVGSALAGLFLEHTMAPLCPGCLGRVQGPTGCLGTGWDAGISAGLRGGESCARESRSTFGT